MKIRCSCAATSAQFSMSSFPFSMRTYLLVKQTGKIKNHLGRVQRWRFGRTNSSKQSQIFVFLALVPEKCTQSNSTEQQTPESKTNRAPRPPPHTVHRHYCAKRYDWCRKPCAIATCRTVRRTGMGKTKASISDASDRGTEFYASGGVLIWHQ